MNWLVLVVLIGLSMPAHATELLRLEAHWKAVDGWQYCGKPVSGLLKVQGPAYVKRVAYEYPYTPLNFITWDPIELARVTKEGAPVRDNPGVTDIYGKLFQDGKEVRDIRPGPLRREHLWHFTANEVYYYRVQIKSPCVRQVGGGQQKQDVLALFTTQSGPDHIAASDTPPFKIQQPKLSARTERWKVRSDPGGYLSNFELRIDANGKVEGVSHWTCCSGPINRISGQITPSGDIQLTRHLEGAHKGMSHTWNGRYAADGRTIEGSWTSGSYGHGNGHWIAELGSSDGATKPEAEAIPPPLTTQQPKLSARTERWKVRSDPGGYLSTFELRIDANGKVEGVSHWTCCSGSTNRITGQITPSGDIQLTRHLEGAHKGMSHTWNGQYAADGRTIEGSWTSGSYGHGNGHWRAEFE